MLVPKTWLTSLRSVWHIQFKVCIFFWCAKIICRKTKNICRNKIDVELYCWFKKQNKTPHHFSVLITSLLTSLITLYLILNNMLIILQDSSNSHFSIFSTNFTNQFFLVNHYNVFSWLMQLVDSSLFMAFSLSNISIVALRKKKKSQTKKVHRTIFTLSLSVVEENHD